MSDYFLAIIQQGRWFEVKSAYGGKYAVKMKANANQASSIDALWLSDYDHESMSIEEYSKDNWKYEHGTFVIYGAGVFNFGSFEIDEENIYDDGCNLIESKLYDVILKNAPDGFVKEEELKGVWSKLVNGVKLDIGVLEVQN
ncbi:hypothetical protein ACFVQB_14670 [Paenibacillus sp. NPDC057886]|uniref:hypothetical protein n=1 Tax=Paenibacillus sp. NPDC057886 TaxID=3346270 RepID=UPI0036858080